MKGGKETVKEEKHMRKIRSILAVVIALSLVAGVSSVQMKKTVSSAASTQPVKKEGEGKGVYRDSDFSLRSRRRKR